MFSIKIIIADCYTHLGSSQCVENIITTSHLRHYRRNYHNRTEGFKKTFSIDLKKIFPQNWLTDFATLLNTTAYLIVYYNKTLSIVNINFNLKFLFYFYCHLCKYLSTFTISRLFDNLLKFLIYKMNLTKPVTTRSIYLIINQKLNCINIYKV